MLYKAKHNLTVGFADRGTKEFKAGQFYKESDLGKEVDISNFEVMSETEAQRDQANANKTVKHILTNAPVAAPAPREGEIS